MLDEELYILGEYDIFKDYLYPEKFIPRVNKMVESAIR